VPATGEQLVVVPSTANIFGAGHEIAPDPAGGGAGVVPPVVELPAAPNVVVTFPCVSGLINCCFGAPDTGPVGTMTYTTVIESWGGISGIIHKSRSVFLVGVFLGDEEPQDPAPERLDFSETCPGECTFDRLAPELGQTFYVGAGGETVEYLAPEGATRLFLGIADAYLTHGNPGWYDNNSGQFEAVVSLP
jgi:hypothetical protein